MNLIKSKENKNGNLISLFGRPFLSIFILFFSFVFFIVLLSSNTVAQSFFCGDFKCQFNESLYCDVDCGTKVSAILDSSYYNFPYAYDSKMTLQLRNQLNYDVLLRFYTDFSNIELPETLILRANEEYFLDIKMNTLVDLGFHSGDFMIEGNLYNPNFYIHDIISKYNVSNVSIQLTNESVNSINSIIFRKTLPFNVKIYSVNETEIVYYKMNLNHDRVKKTDKIFFSIETNDKTNQSLSFSLKNNKTNLELNYTVEDNLYIIDLNKYNVSEGEYRVVLNYNYNNYNLESTESIEVYLSLISQNVLYLILRIFIVFLLVFIVFIAILKIKKYKLSKQTFIHPNFSKIPDNKETNFLMGKIPETTKKAYFDPDKLTTHTLVAGSTGSGKSVTASIFVEECLLHNIPVIIFDPTAQWTGFVKACRDEVVLKTYSNFGLTEDDARSFKGLIYNVNDENIVVDFKKYINPGEVTVFNLAKLNTEQYNLATENIIKQLFQFGFDETPHLRVLIVFDEVHRLLDQYGGQGGYHSLEKAAREFRKWGLGLLMISQVSSDFKEAIGGNVLTEIQLNTKSIEDIKKMESKYGKEYSKAIIRLKIGMGIIQNPHFNLGNPWFIHFRPPLHSPHKISDDELIMYDTYARQIDEMEARLIKLKETKDVSDVELEINLAKKKLKEGKFKMVKIYLETLESSINSL
ncbi:MAG: DUF87 domain-containing protein [Candidatus Nanoarchaeia archaeon]|nr:DUF87 domain-containing protein [Candidatus Nanoarchaeia archaeon]